MVLRKQRRWRSTHLKEKVPVKKAPPPKKEVKKEEPKP
jgi:hypothetical protein